MRWLAHIPRRLVGHPAAYHRPMSLVAYCDRCEHELQDGEMAVWTEPRVPRRGHPARTYHEACYPDRRDERETQRGPFSASQPEGPRRPDPTERDWRTLSAKATRSERPRSLLMECCSAFASTKPPSLPATRPWHATADRFLDATRPQLVPLLLILGLAASFASQVLPLPAGMVPLAAFFLFGGGWCSLNFVRSREAHCVLDGLGWDALAIAALLTIPLGVDWRSPLWVAFFAILAGAIAFEAVWARLRGSTAIA